MFGTKINSSRQLTLKSKRSMKLL